MNSTWQFWFINLLRTRRKEEINPMRNEKGDRESLVSRDREFVCNSLYKRHI
jgi:hypothetical protein